MSRTGLKLIAVVGGALAALPAVAAPAPLPATPVLSADPAWVRGVLIAVACVFAAALALGPLLRMGLPDELPETHSHDEPPGSSHHHGPGGTVDLVMSGKK
jgi:hypothetical protein